jgi:hypothetical protein
MKRVLMFAAASVVLARSLDAQAATQQAAFGPWPGSEIRFTIDSLGSGAQLGRLIARGADSLYIRRTVTGDSVALAMQRLISLEARTERAHKKVGALLGALTGGLIGFAIAHNDHYQPNQLDELNAARDGHEAAGAFYGALTGVVAGTITGALLRTTTWQRIPLLRDYLRGQ